MKKLLFALALLSLINSLAWAMRDRTNKEYVEALKKKIINLASKHADVDLKEPQFGKLFFYGKDLWVVHLEGLKKYSYFFEGSKKPTYFVEEKFFEVCVRRGENGDFNNFFELTDCSKVKKSSPVFIEFDI